MTPLVPHTLALICAGLFAGGAMMQSIVDHPARCSADKAAGIDQMQRALRGADPYMPLLAVAGAGTAFWSFLVGGGLIELVAAVLLIAVVPFTFALIIPINTRIHRYRPGDANLEEIASHMQRWGQLHAMRSICGTLALVALAAGTLLQPYLA